MRTSRNSSVLSCEGSYFTEGGYNAVEIEQVEENQVSGEHWNLFGVMNGLRERTEFWSSHHSREAVVIAPPGN